MNLQEHCELGAKLFGHDCELGKILVDLSHRFPNTGPIVRGSSKVLAALSRLRKELENEAYRYCDGDAVHSAGPYYGDKARQRWERETVILQRIEKKLDRVLEGQ